MDGGEGADEGKGNSPPGTEDPVRRFKYWRYGNWWPIMLPESEGRAAYPDILPDWDEEGGAGADGGEGADDEEKSPPPPGEPPPYVPPPVEALGGAGDDGGEGADESPPPEPMDFSPPPAPLSDAPVDFVPSLPPYVPPPAEALGGAGDAGGEGADEGGGETPPGGAGDDGGEGAQTPDSPGFGFLESLPSGGVSDLESTGPPPAGGQGGAGMDGGDPDADKSGVDTGTPDISRDPDDVGPQPLPDGGSVTITAHEIVPSVGPPPAGGAGDDGGEGADEGGEEGTGGAGMDGGDPDANGGEGAEDKGATGSSSQPLYNIFGETSRYFEWGWRPRDLPVNPPGGVGVPGGAGADGGEGAGEGGGTPRTSGGGTFDSYFPVKPILSFTDFSPPPNPFGDDYPVEFGEPPPYVPPPAEPLGGAGMDGGEGADEGGGETPPGGDTLQPSLDSGFIYSGHPASSSAGVPMPPALPEGTSIRDLGVDLFFGSGLDTLLPPTAGENLGGGAAPGAAGPGPINGTLNPNLDPQLDTGSAVLDGAGALAPLGNVGPNPNLVALHNNLHNQQQGDLAAFNLQQTQQHDAFHNNFAANPLFNALHQNFHTNKDQTEQNFQAQQNADHAGFHNANPGI